MEQGTQLNHYRVTRKLGEGGMGQVFAAEDTRLRREVAIKVLPPEVAGDSERLARMEREAQVLAALEHPNIAAIYGFEDADVGGRSVKFLAMQLAEGETLADRIGSGPVSLGEVLQIAMQVAQGLEAAHERGIVHRDLKPANVQIGTDGTVKLLDFGLAKAIEGDHSETSVELTASPTVLEATRAGVILGTAAYMSPEQARGYKVDQRTDIWAFGAVLYEMLSGRRLYEGETATDVLGGIVHKEPDWKALPRGTPRRIVVLLKRCLRKDPKRRLQAIGDARITIEDYLEDPQAAEAMMGAETPAWQRLLPWAVAASLAVALGATAVLGGGGDAAPAEVMRTQIVIEDGALFPQAGSAVALSPAGGPMVLVEGEPNTPTGVRLWSRALDDPKFTELAPAFAYQPFFSPDGQWVGFVSLAELMKVPVTGGTPLGLAEVARSRGASWGPNGTIVFAASPTSGLSLVSEEGGEVAPLTTLDEAASEATHRWPQFLPGGEAVLFTSHGQVGDFDRATLEVVDVASGVRKVVHRGGSYGRYLPTGHLVYLNSETLFAVPFDLGALEVSGSAAPVVENVGSSLVEGYAHFDVSPQGLLVYQAAEREEVPVHPVEWVDREGQAVVMWDDPATYAEPHVSPDGSKISFMVLTGTNWDVWVYDVARDVATRLTFDPAMEGPGIWSPDGEELIYASDANGAHDLYRRRADGSGDVEQLTDDTAQAYIVSSWSADGRHLMITSLSGGGLMYLDLEEDGGEPQSFMPVAGNAAEALFSPDGRWVAYQSNESGQEEVYVRPFPPAGGKWQVSDGGGAYPQWAADGTELFYRTDDGVAVVPVDLTGASFSAGRSRQLLTGSYRGGIGGVTLGGNDFAHYAVAPDGRFVLFPAPAVEEEPNVGWLQVVTNWFEELRRRMPTDS